MPKRNLLFALIIYASILIAHADAQERTYFDSLMLLRKNTISLIQLIAYPDRYQGVRVTVVGYLHLRFEDASLYLSKSDADHLIGVNAVWVGMSDNVTQYPAPSESQRDANKSLEYFDSKYVTITGVFNKDNKGHMGSFSGALDSVNVIIEKPQWYDGKKELLH